MADQCETPMADHVKRFFELLKVPGAIVRVDTPNPLGYDTANFGEGFAVVLSSRVEALDELVALRTDDLADKAEEIAMLRDAETRWIARLAFVREITGDGGKMMLDEFQEWFESRWAELLAAEAALTTERRAKEEAEREREDARVERGNIAEDYRELETKLRNTFADAQSMKRRAESAETRSAELARALEETKEALRPFAVVGEKATKYRAGKPDDGGFYSTLIDGKYDMTWGDLCRAHATLEASK